jgi:hypothetical protein
MASHRTADTPDAKRPRQPRMHIDLRREQVLDATLRLHLLRAVEAARDSWRLLLQPWSDAPTQIRRRLEGGREFALSRLRDLLRWGHDRRPGLADLDLDLLALSLLAIGEQAVRIILSDPDGFTSERYGRFARALLAVTSSQRSCSPCTSLSSEPASSACP